MTMTPLNLAASLAALSSPGVNPDILHAMHRIFVWGGLGGSDLCRSGPYDSLRSSR
jgi:hypothetical protein